MKIIIEHGRVKREISGAFNICGSKSDLEMLMQQLIRGIAGDFNYGWVEILPCVPQPSITDTAPLPWDR